MEEVQYNCVECGCPVDELTEHCGRCYGSQETLAAIARQDEHANRLRSLRIRNRRLDEVERKIDAPPWLEAIGDER